MEKFFLIGFVSIADYPCFLLPVIKNNNNLYLAISNKDTDIIVEFEEISSEMFNSYNIFRRVNSRLIYLGEPTIYCYALEKNDFCYGNKYDVITYIISNDIIKKTVDSMQAFYQQKELYYFVNDFQRWCDFLNNSFSDDQGFINNEKDNYKDFLLYNAKNIHLMIYSNPTDAFCIKKLFNDSVEQMNLTINTNILYYDMCANTDINYDIIVFDFAAVKQGQYNEYKISHPQQKIQ